MLEPEAYRSLVHRVMLIVLFVGCGSASEEAEAPASPPGAEAPSQAEAGPETEPSEPSETETPTETEPSAATAGAAPQAAERRHRRRRRRHALREPLEPGELCEGVSIPDALRECEVDDECRLYRGPCSTVGGRVDAEEAIQPLVDRCRGEPGDSCLGVSLGLPECRDGRCEQGPGL